MKITYDYQIFSNQKYGGISRYFYEIAKNIQEIKGGDVEIFSPIYINEYIESSGKIKITGKKSKHLSHPILPTKIINASLAYLYKYLNRSTNIFHETYYSPLDLSPVSAKRIITVFDMIHERFPELFSPKDSTRRTKLQALARADHIICISENTRQDLLELTDTPIEKTSVVHLGYSTMKDTQVIRSPTPRSSPYILYVGSRSGYKNFELLLKAYSKDLFRKHFSLICFGGGEAKENELAMIQSYGIKSKDVTFLAGNDDLLASLYKNASAFVYPSLYEGFGIPPLEAMSQGCPVICSNTSSIPEVVGNSAELFDPYELESLSTALENVLCSTEHSRLLIERGYERVKLFTWDKCAVETLNVYKKILGT